MRLILSAALCAALLASPALGHDRKHGHHDQSRDGHDDGMPMGADFPPPPYGYYDGRHDAPVDPRWEEDQARFHDEWRERCGDRDDRDCLRSAPYGYAHPGAYMGYAVPMIMVPVLRNKPCKEVVEEIVEEVPVTVRRRVIRPRARIVPDKRVRIMPDKRVPMTPTKRIPY